MMIAVESVVIVLIGILDLASTLFWVHHHGAAEANPIFSRYLAMGTAWFIASKVVMLVAPVLLLEWARRRRPRFTRWASRFAIVAYLSLYMVGVARLNPDLLHPGSPRNLVAMLMAPGESAAWADARPDGFRVHFRPEMMRDYMRQYMLHRKQMWRRGHPGVRLAPPRRMQLEDAISPPHRTWTSETASPDYIARSD